MKNVISSHDAPAAIGAYSQAIEFQGLIFISGQLGISPDTGKFLGESVEAQAKQAIENIGAILYAAESGYSNIIKTTIFLVDMNDFSKVNDIYKEYFDEDPPARSTVQVAALPKGGLVEIEVIAVKKALCR